ncbi:DUF7948 domain-containing protein [Sulfidibacter corallicola]|uniref:DUF7948 domain-containing protein n=1 Tax=Sulfidibacter corallicola TaxID=2818388 RepID=A0A8A4TLL9_SULCO|nr:hypothetical protein [Sulfidibacter corallicola]QTD49781.1 hypothetical protein J3U87_29715 [Sulfidibacter corallicola]
MNFYSGPRERWRTGLVPHQGLVFEQVWPGVDVTFEIRDNRLYQKWRVRPGTTGRSWAFDLGAEALKSNAEGSLEATFESRRLVIPKPRAWQGSGTARTELKLSFEVQEGRYAVVRVEGGDPETGWDIDFGLNWLHLFGGHGSPDPIQNMVCDGDRYCFFLATAGTWESVTLSKWDTQERRLVFSSRFSGLVGSEGTALTLTSDGDPIFSTSLFFGEHPTASGGYDTRSGSGDFYIGRLDGETGRSVAGTYTGEEGESWTEHLALDILELADGRIALTGWTQREDFPVTDDAFDGTFNGSRDAFLAIFDKDFTDLQYSTFLGGISNDHGVALALDEAENLVVLGSTRSHDLPTTFGVLSEDALGGTDGFLAKFSPAEHRFLWMTYFGGWDEEVPGNLIVNREGLFVVGTTRSPNFPTTTDALGQQLSGISDGFLMQLSGDGDALIHGTFLGGSRNDGIQDLHRDVGGRLWLCGTSESDDFPVTANSVQSQRDGGEDIWFARWDPAVKHVDYASYLGGVNADDPAGIAALGSGQVILAGGTASRDFPVTDDAEDLFLEGSSSGFVSHVDVVRGTLGYSTFLDQSGWDTIVDLEQDASGMLIAAGLTDSAFFPVSDHAPDPTFLARSVEAFVMRFDPTTGEPLFTTFLGGTLDEKVAGIDLDDRGTLYLAGSTASIDFPVTADAAFSTLQHPRAGFSAKIDPVTGTLGFSTYLPPGNDPDSFGFEPRALAVDPSGRTWLTGGTSQRGLPTTANAFDSAFEGEAGEVYLCALSADGTEFEFGSYLGGSEDDASHDLALDAQGGLYVGGVTCSTDFPVTSGVFDESYNGDCDGFLAKVSISDGSLRFATYLGGSEHDVLKAMALDRNDRPVLAIRTATTELPASAAAFSQGHPYSFFHTYVGKIDPNGSEITRGTYLGSIVLSEYADANLLMGREDRILLVGRADGCNPQFTPGVPFPSNCGFLTFPSILTHLRADLSDLIYAGSVPAGTWVNSAVWDGDDTYYIAGSSALPETHPLFPGEPSLGRGIADGLVASMDLGCIPPSLSGNAPTSVLDLVQVITDEGRCPDGVTCPGDWRRDGTIQYGDFWILFPYWAKEFCP